MGHDTLTVLSTSQLSRATGATVRQIDYWVSHGVLPSYKTGNGSGHRRTYDTWAVPRVRLLAQISEAFRAGAFGAGANLAVLAYIYAHYDAGRMPIGAHAALTWDVEET